MALTTAAPVLRALVQHLRTVTELTGGLTGGIHEGLAPDATAWPFLIYNLQWSNYRYDSTGAIMTGLVTLQVVSDDQVEARNLDALVMTALHDAALTVSGQTTLYCRRSMDLYSVDTDAQGKRVYMVGGMYDIWTDQALP
jgi:hypothetical protein